MEEHLLHFIWHRKLFDHSHLVTTTGAMVDIQHTGFANQHQGPDFLQARVSIDGQLWAGHVEIHVRSSAWYLHMHDKDAHYKNVILHVVWQEDQPVYTPDGGLIPCLELAERVDTALLDRYRKLMSNEEWVPCAPALADVTPVLRTSWLSRMMVERIEEKSETVHRIREKYKGDWEQTFYVLLARQLAAPVNSDAMEDLCSLVPLTLLRKHKNRPDQIEAMLFGAAGLIAREIHDPYIEKLRDEFSFLRRKYNLRSLEALRWKFLRMRPPSFPTIRIAQLSKIISESDGFVSLVEHLHKGDDWIALFRVVPEHAFWEDHYHFTAASSHHAKRVGKSTAIGLVINVVAPLMFEYGKHQGKPGLKETALSLLEGFPPEKNAILTGWEKSGWKAENAGQSQALIQLKKRYCNHRKCLHCAIGLQVIRE